MAYGEKYILSFISERGNDYKISILQQSYSGSAVSKKLGVAPSLSIEEGDGRIKGSSLSFSIQADVEGELSGLYTTNNKEFKVILYRNNSVYWQGYLLPELYSENYVDPPFDVAVTATDQLATLKDIPYQAQEQQMSLLSIIKNILNYTEITLPCTVHMQIEDSQGLSLLENHHISAAAMNGYSCYDALSALLLSCNACIMQIGNEWLITSLTDNTSAYYKEGQLINRPHPTIGQMHKADIYPDGSLTMVNAPAIKGATLEYNHILRNSMLKNAECRSREYWNYLPGEVDARFPSEFQAIDGVVYKCFSWSLQEKNIAKDSSLQLWQDVQLNTDESFNYQLSVKYLSDIRSKLLLLSIAHYGDDGIVRRLTAEGWKKSVDKNDINSYIQITSSQTDYTARYVWDIADTSKYEVANVQFALPEVSGSLRVGFINSTTDYDEPVMLGGMFVTDIFLTPLNIAGKRATTVVEQLATTSQQEVVISYGDKTQSNNDSLISFNTLRSAQGGYVNAWNLSGREYSSYFLMMLQEFSRYFGSKRMQLQGAIMGKDILHPFYVDSFSGKILRLLSAQYDLLQDTMSTNIEEVPVAFVEYDTTVYAKENVQNNQSTSGSVVAAGGGESLLSEQSDGDVYVKNDRPLTGFEARFGQLAIPKAAPTAPKEGERYIFLDDSATSEDELQADAFNLKVVIEKLKKFDSMWKLDLEKDAVRTTYNVIIDKGISFGGPGKSSSTGEGITTFDVYIGDKGPYSLQNGKVNLPAYPVVPNALPNPFKLTINGTSYDGSAPVDIEIKAGVDDAQLLEYAKKEWVTEQGYIKEIPSDVITEDELGSKGYATEKWVNQQGFLKEQDISHLATKVQLSTTNTNVSNLQTAHNTLRNEFDALNGLLSDDTTGYIDTWNEVKSFLNGYADSTDLAAILSGMNKDIANRATIEALNAATLRIDTLETTLSTEQSYIDTLQGYFTSGKAKKAIADGNGNNIVDTYATKVALNTTNTSLETLSKEFSEFKELVNNLWYLDPDHADTVRTKLNVVIEQAISFGGYSESSGSGGGITTVTKQMVLDALGYTPYDAANPKGYITASAIPTSLKNPYGLTINNSAGTAQVSYDGSVTKSLTLTKAMVGLSNVQNTAVYTRNLGVNGGSWTFASTYYTEDGKSTSIYAPTTAGTAGQYLISNGTGAPYWYTINPYDSNISRTANTVLAAPSGYDGSATFRKLVSADIPSLDWSKITSGKPTTVSGYGITDAITTSNISSQSVNYATSAGSATKLTNTRTIWGQSFNGTKNISGSLSDVTTITASGNISTDGNLVTSLDVYGNYFLIKNRSSNPYYKLTDGSYSGYCQLLTDGSIALGPTSYYSLTVGQTGLVTINGNLVVTGKITMGNASDRRLKDNIKSMTNKQAVAVLSALNPVTFQWNTTAYELGKLSGVSDGFIADEYEKIIPNSGRDIWTNYRAINYERATGYLVKGWQNHETRLKKAERRIKELENELKQYRA